MTSLRLTVFPKGPDILYGLLSDDAQAGLLIGQGRQYDGGVDHAHQQAIVASKRSVWPRLLR